MGAMFTNKRDRAARVAEGHQIFAEQPHAYGGAITARQIVGQHCRHPIAPEQFAHRCAGARPRQKLIFFTLHWGLIVAARYRSCEKNVRMLQAWGIPLLASTASVSANSLPTAPGWRSARPRPATRTSPRGWI